MYVTSGSNAMVDEARIGSLYDDHRATHHLYITLALELSYNVVSEKPLAFTEEVPAMTASYFKTCSASQEPMSTEGLQAMLTGRY